jgi:hypothetical protein
MTFNAIVINGVIVVDGAESLPHAMQVEAKSNLCQLPDCNLGDMLLRQGGRLIGYCRTPGSLSKT